MGWFKSMQGKTNDGSCCPKCLAKPCDSCVCPTISINVLVSSAEATRSKCGFAEYIPSSPPKYYKVETTNWSGGGNASVNRTDCCCNLTPEGECDRTETFGPWTRSLSIGVTAVAEKTPEANGACSETENYTGTSTSTYAIPPLEPAWNEENCPACPSGATRTEVATWSGPASSVVVTNETDCNGAPYPPLTDPGLPPPAPTLMVPETATKASGVASVHITPSTYISCDKSEPSNLQYANVDVTAELSSEDTTAALIGRVHAAKGTPGTPGAGGGAVEAIRLLSDNEASYKEKDSKYQFTWEPPEEDVAYKITWDVIFTPTGGAESVESSETWTGMSSAGATPIYSLSVPATNGTRRIANIQTRCPGIEE